MTTSWKWTPMLPMRKVAKRWHELSDAERAAVMRDHLTWNPEELAASRWELIGYRKAPSGGLVEEDRRMVFDEDYHHDLKKEGG